MCIIRIVDVYVCSNAAHVDIDNASLPTPRCQCDFGRVAIARLPVRADELGDRRKCEHATQEALHNGYRVVIDRTNIDEHQRSHWLRIARQCRVPGERVRDGVGLEDVRDGHRGCEEENRASRPLLSLLT